MTADAFINYCDRAFGIILLKLLDNGKVSEYDILYKPSDLKIMSSNELLQQLTQALTQVLGGGNNGGLGFCPIPENQNSVKYLFPGYDECSIGRPPYLVGLDENKNHVPIPQPALKGKLKFLNLVDTVRAGQETQKLEFWIDCGARTYVVLLGWADQYGKLNNATESFLKALASLTPDELLEPFTFTLSRLIDKASYDPTKGNPATAGKVLLADVWKNSGESVYYEQGSMDANAACSVILRINQQLTGQAVLTPRQPKTKPQPQTQQQWGQQPQQYQQPAPVPQPQAQPQQWGQPQPTPQPQVQQALPVVGGLTPEQMQQFLAFQQQQQSQNLPQPQPTPLEQAQQSIAQPPQWGSPAPQPAPIQNGNGGSKVNW